MILNIQRCQQIDSMFIANFSESLLNLFLEYGFVGLTREASITFEQNTKKRKKLFAQSVESNAF